MGLPLASRYTKRRDQIVAIDLGAKTTKAVQVECRSNGFTLIDFIVTNTPDWENTSEPTSLAEHLKRVVQHFGGRPKHLAIALGVQDTVFKQVEVPLMPIPDLRLMLKYNSKAYLQQEMADHVFDCQYGLDTTVRSSEAVKTPNQKFKAMVGAARKPLIDKCQLACRMAGLQLDEIVPGVVGPINTFELTEPDSFNRDVVALVDFGFRSTSITILQSGEIALNRVLTIGGDRLTSGLAESLGITYPEAENIKIGMPGEVAPDLVPLIHPLGRELRASIDYFENHHDKAVSRVLLSGGAAQSDLIVNTLQAELMVPCCPWNAGSNLKHLLPPDRVGLLETNGSHLAVAIGAASAGI